MASKTPIEEKIAALLAKAESTTPEEAEALTEHAERLMLRHGIEQATVEAARAGRERKAEVIVERSIPFTGVYARAFVCLGATVAKAYGPVRTYRIDVQRGSGSTLYLVGYESDVRAVETLVTSLILQARVGLDAYWKAFRDATKARWGHSVNVLLSPSEISARKRDYLLGFGAGAAQRLTDTRRAVHEEAEAATPGSTLAVVDRQAAVDNYVASLGLRKGRSLKVGDGYASGHVAGRRADVGATAVGGTRALGA